MTSNYLCKNGSSVLAVYRLASSNGVVPTEEDESFLCIPYIDYFYRSTNYSHCQVIRVLYLIIKFFFFLFLLYSPFVCLLELRYRLFWKSCRNIQTIDR